jgi:hypothetical protein
MNDSCIVTLRLDERTKEMLEALEKKEKDIAAREDRPAKKKTGIIRQLISEKYMEQIDGEASFSYLSIMKKEMEILLDSYFSAQRDHIQKLAAKNADSIDFNYYVIAKMIGMILCGEGFPNNEETFFEVVKRDYVYREIVEENILEKQLKKASKTLQSCLSILTE